MSVDKSNSWRLKWEKMEMRFFNFFLEWNYSQWGNWTNKKWETSYTKLHFPTSYARRERERDKKSPFRKLVISLFRCSSAFFFFFHACIILKHIKGSIVSWKRKFLMKKKMIKIQQKLLNDWEFDVYSSFKTNLKPLSSNLQMHHCIVGCIGFLKNEKFSPNSQWNKKE